MQDGTAHYGDSLTDKSQSDSSDGGSNEVGSNEVGSNEVGSSEGKIVSSVLNLYAHTSHAQRVEQADLVMICRYDGEAVQVEPDETSPAQYTGKVYTDQYVTPIKVAKGTASGSVAVRVAGGDAGNVIYSGDDPVLTKGKSYLLYLKKVRPSGKTILNTIKCSAVFNAVSRSMTTVLLI